MALTTTFSGGKKIPSQKKGKGEGESMGMSQKWQESRRWEGNTSKRGEQNFRPTLPAKLTAEKEKSRQVSDFMDAAGKKGGKGGLSTNSLAKGRG